MCLREAFLRTAESVYRFILVRVAGDRETADELLQECCCQAARSRVGPKDPPAFETWFRGIARNLIRRHWRRRRIDRRLLSASHAEGLAGVAAKSATEPLPSEQLESRESSAALLLAMQRLGRKDRELLLAFYFDGRSTAELSAEIQVTAKAIEARLRRARDRLRALLAGGNGVETA